MVDFQDKVADTQDKVNNRAATLAVLLMDLRESEIPVMSYLS